MQNRYGHFLTFSASESGTQVLHVKELKASSQPGCIRYCTLISSYSAAKSVEVEGWAYEKLVAIDPIEKCCSYELLENNIGYNSYVATWKLGDFQDEEADGREVIWSFVVKPVEGQTLEEMVSFIDSVLQIMAKLMEEEVKKE